jgi:ABC-type phosphate/phosphonate transport system permease subunit
MSAMSNAATLLGGLVALPLAAAATIHLVFEHRRKQARKRRKLRHGIKAARWKVLSDLIASRKIRRLTYQSQERPDDPDQGL